MCTVVRHQFNITISKSASAATVSWYISYNPLALSIYPQPVSFLLSRYFTFNSHTPLANVHIATGWHSSAKQKSHLISPFSFGLGHKVLFKKIKWEGIISEIIRSSTGCVSEAGGEPVVPLAQVFNGGRGSYASRLKMSLFLPLSPSQSRFSLSFLPTF